MMNVDRKPFSIQMSTERFECVCECEYKMYDVVTNLRQSKPF